MSGFSLRYHNLLNAAKALINPATEEKQDDAITALGLVASANQDLLLAELQLKADLTETQPVSAATLPLPTGAATSANQTTLITQSPVDDVSGARTVITYQHHKIHEGDTYIINEAYDLAINNVIDIRITTPNTTKWAHWVLEFDTESEYEFWFYEVAVITVAGSAYTPINLNRNSVNTSVLAVDIITNASLALANADTDVTGATTLMHGFAGAGKTTGGSQSIREEFILKQNTIYGFRAVANAAGWIHENMAWYEHESLA
jgi:hypothetical protein